MSMVEADGRIRELYGHLVPLQGVSLLVPKSAVLEVQGMDGISVETQGPAWLLGDTDWRGRRLSVVSLEAMAGQSVPGRSRRSRVLVLNSLGTYLENGLFCIVTQGYPHLTALNPVALHRQDDLPQDEAIALSRVRLANTDALIPDFEQIERRLHEALSNAQVAHTAETAWEPGATLDQPHSET